MRDEHNVQINKTGKNGKNETKEPCLPELTEDDFNRYGGIVNLRSLSGQVFATAAALARYASEHKDDCDPETVKEAGETLMYFAYRDVSAQNRGKRIRRRPAETSPTENV